MAFFAMFIAIVNIIIILLSPSTVFIKPFSIALSVLIFYFGWKSISEFEMIQRIKMLFFIYHLEKEARKKAQEVIENAYKTSRQAR